MNFECENFCVESEFDTWVLQNFFSSEQSSDESENSSDMSQILKENCLVLKKNDWNKVIDQKKILEINYQDLLDILKHNNLSRKEIQQVKDCRKKAQRAKSSLKCHANKRKLELQQEQDVKCLSQLKQQLQIEKMKLTEEIKFYQHEFQQMSN